MSTIAQVARAHKDILVETAAALARPSGFVQRRSKLDGRKMAQTLVVGWQQQPMATLSDLAQTAACLGVSITPQGLDARFNERTATFLRQLLEAAMMRLITIAGDERELPALFARFTGVHLQDSTTLPLPATLSTQWPGHGNNRREPTAGLKVQVRLELTTGWLDQLAIQASRTQEREAALQRAPLPAGSLRLADLGYFTLSVLRDHAAAGVYYITRCRADTCVMVKPEQPLSLLDLLKRYAVNSRIDQPILLGKAEQLPCRLVGWRVPEAVAEQRRRRIRDQARKQQRAPNPTSLALAAWTVFVTNLPLALATPAEIELLARVRWQIELLFKRWKSCGKLTTSASQKPWRILCAVYAKLLGVLLQHWLLIATAWTCTDRSFCKALTTLQRFALEMGRKLDDLQALADLITFIKGCLAHTGKVNKRRKSPSTSQLLMQQA